MDCGDARCRDSECNGTLLGTFWWLELLLIRKTASGFPTLQSCRSSTEDGKRKATLTTCIRQICQTKFLICALQITKWVFLLLLSLHDTVIEKYKVASWAESGVLALFFLFSF